MNKIWEKIQNKRLILVSVLIGLAGTLFLTGLNTVQLKRENREIKARLQREIQQGIAGEVFRLHVIANSDTEEDQKLKLKIKTRIVEYLEEILGKDADLEKTKEAVLTHLGEIEREAEKLVHEQGFDYPVKAVVEKTYFPKKSYGDCTFPAGEYEALNVKIGGARGHNWWCVLYPSLCFIEDTYGVVTEEKKEDLKSVLTTEEFLEILEKPEEKKTIRFRFRWF